MINKTDIWVSRLNKLTRKMEEIEESTHPSVWWEQTQNLQEQFHREVRKLKEKSNE